MKKIVIILILVILFSVFLFYIAKSSDGDADKNQENPDNEITGEIINDNSNLNGDSDNINDISGGSLEGESSSNGGSSGASDGTASDEIDDSENPVNLPPDINEKECGFYFDEYEVCAGVCPDGECVNEGRSCYCKKV